MVVSHNPVVWALCYLCNCHINATRCTCWHLLLPHTLLCACLWLYQTKSKRYRERFAATRGRHTYCFTNPVHSPQDRCIQTISRSSRKEHLACRVGIRRQSKYSTFLIWRIVPMPECLLCYISRLHFDQRALTATDTNRSRIRIACNVLQQSTCANRGYVSYHCLYRSTQLRGMGV